MPTCGLCLSRNLLLAVAADDDGRLHSPLAVSRTDDDRWWLLEHLEQTEGLDFALVVADSMLRLDSVAHLARQRGIVVWVAPDWLVAAIVAATGSATGPPRRRAAVLARMPRVPSLRPFLRCLAGEQADHRQISLLET